MAAKRRAQHSCSPPERDSARESAPSQGSGLRPSFRATLGLKGSSPRRLPPGPYLSRRKSPRDRQKLKEPTFSWSLPHGNPVAESPLGSQHLQAEGIVVNSL